MEKIASTTNPSFFSLSILIDCFVLYRFLIWINRLLSGSWSFLQSQLNFGNSEILDEKKNLDFEGSTRQICSDERKDGGNLHRDDAEKVMERLGLFCSPEGEELKEWMSSDDLSELFEEKEPSLEEVKQAFDVFDENKDGFIDARELQRVLCNLGLKEGFELENCRKMIKAFDENRDERIDFNEFVKFMENSFS